ncbi:hypothetical protein LOZ66_006096 [Ophidiomyces ophidiicola]|nr:hypothetical protein LOZ66_006096 [Ophidiomyces ophidiicola]
MTSLMSKRSVFTTVTPLPPYISRETVIETLHQHAEMIELNPLVIKHERCKPMATAPADEFHCIWYELTDKIHYLPGGIICGNISYKACFHDLPRGLQTHVYAPTGLDIKEKWTVGGNMPGEPREPVELGLTDAPREGLYLREDVDMRCNILSTNFVKKTLKKAHSVLIDRLILKADILRQRSDQYSPYLHSSITAGSAYAPTDTDSYRSSVQSPTSIVFPPGTPDMNSQAPHSFMPQNELHFQPMSNTLNVNHASHLSNAKSVIISEIDGTPITRPEIRVEQAESNQKKGESAAVPKNDKAPEQTS